MGSPENLALKDAQDFLLDASLEEKVEDRTEQLPGFEKKIIAQKKFSIDYSNVSTLKELITALEKEVKQLKELQKGHPGVKVERRNAEVFLVVESNY